MRPWTGRPSHQQVFEEARAQGLTLLQSKLLASRWAKVPEVGLRETLWPQAKHLPRASNLPDIHIAACTIADAIARQQVIALILDSDCDGQNSGVVLLRALTEIFGVGPTCVHVVTSKRMTEGYGVSAKFVERILQLEPRPQLIITADQGSADDVRIGTLREHGIPVVVSDHHAIPDEGPPAAALACVNPARSDSEFGDPSISGAVVAWYLMVAVHQELTARGVPCSPSGTFHDLLPYVALSVAADCVDLGRSTANRWVMQQGLARIERGAAPIWSAFAPFVRHEWTSTNLSFCVTNRINAAWRIGDAMRGIEAMCSPDVETAQAWVAVLDAANEERKVIQSRLVDRAMCVAQEQRLAGVRGLCIPFYEDGHSGVHGITAARILEMTGCPVVCLSAVEGEPEQMTGSIRSVDGAHVKQLIASIARTHPEWHLTGGGHSHAGGVHLAKTHVPAFAIAWDQAVAAALEGVGVVPRHHDGPLPAPPSTALLDEISMLEPYGRGFPEPVFADVVHVVRIRALGKDGKHAQFDVVFDDGTPARMVWFNCTQDGTLPELVGRCHIVFELRRSKFSRGPGFDLLVREA